jgi:hypothetical protein
MRLLPLLVGLLLLAACGENVQWAFVSNTSGSGGQQGLIVVIRTSSSGVSLATSVLQVRGHDDEGALTVDLPHGGDIAVLERPDRVELRSPVLPNSSVTLPGARVEPSPAPECLRIVVQDAQALHPLALGAGVVHVAATGTLFVLESPTSIVVFGIDPEPEALPPNVQLTTSPAGDSLALLLGDGRMRILQPRPPATPEMRLAQNMRHDSFRVFGPWREALAELPSRMVEVQPGSELFLRAVITGGIPGVPRPTTLMTPRNNRFLLRVDEP